MVNMAEKWTNQQEISICVANLTSRKSGISVAKRRRIPMKRMLSILLMLMLVPCAALAEPMRDRLCTMIR